MATKSPEQSKNNCSKKELPRKALRNSAPKKNKTPRPSTVSHSFNDGMLNVAVRAAIEAGKIQARAFGNRKNLSISAKSSGDFVTEVDRFLWTGHHRKLFLRPTPNHRFLGEETALKATKKVNTNGLLIRWTGPRTSFTVLINLLCLLLAKKVNICYMPWSTIHAEISYLQQLKGKGAFLTAPESVPLLPQSWETPWLVPVFLQRRWWLWILHEYSQRHDGIHMRPEDLVLQP